MNRNPKMFKFPRKEMQVSDQISKKRQDGMLVEPPKMKDPSREKVPIVVEKQSIVPQVAKEGKEGSRKEQTGSRRDQAARMNEQGVLFDKKLTRLSLPDHMQKIKFVSKIENKLLSCLQKKKPLLPMKKLVKLDMLNEVLGKKHRKLSTERPHFIDSLDVQAQSMKKHEDRSSNDDSKRTKITHPSPIQPQEDPRMRMKVMPLRVPAFQKEEEQPPLLFFNEEQPPFEVVQDDYKLFFSQEDTIFECIGQQKPSISFQQIPKNNLFEQRKSSFIKRQANSTFFSDINEYSFDENHFNSQRRRPSHPIFQERHSQMEIGKLRVPREERRNNSGNGCEGLGIFAIEEENSHFFSPDKQQNRQHVQGGQRANPEQFWKGNQSSSSDQYY